MRMRILIALGLVLLLAGCGVTQHARDAGVISAHLVALESLYDDAEVVYHAHLDHLPTEDQQRARAAWRQIAQVQERLAAIDATDLLRDSHAVDALYADARAAYLALRPLAEERIQAGALGPIERARLREIDRRARELDQHMQRVADGMPPVRRVLRTARDLAPLVLMLMEGMR